MTSSSTIQLCLVNNDPTATLLTTSDGMPMFSVETPPIPDFDLRITAPGVPSHKGTMTKIKRLERYHMSTGHVETEIGVVSYKGPKNGTQLLLSEESNRALEVPPRNALMNVEHDDETFSDENSWEFSGSDSKRYKWQMFAHSPILLTADNSLIPLARFRRAKIGIVSRSRRAFLEILPAGINIIDLIVVTFVAFMKQRVLIEDQCYSTGNSPNSSPPAESPASECPPPLASKLSSSCPLLAPDRLNPMISTSSVASRS